MARTTFAFWQIGDAMTAMTFADINKRNRAFWADQQRLLESRMSDAVIREIAFEVLDDEVGRGVPIRIRKSIYAALENAAKAKHRFLGQLARKGGTAPKGDSLQALIERIVTDRLDITEAELLACLESYQHIEAIEDIVEGTIYFGAADGRWKEAPVSGLKDRLSRAKKKIKSR